MRNRITWPFRIIGSILWYSWQFVAANVKVTREIITPGHQTHPSIVRYPTRCATELEVSMLNLLISLTPGTLAMATEDHHGPHSDNGGRFDVYVHSMFERDPDAVRREVRALEDHALAALRPSRLPHTEEVTW